jgi:hypothetical protein
LSAFCGHGIILAMKVRHLPELDDYLDRLRALPFVKNIDVTLAESNTAQHEDARLSLRTEKGRQQLSVEVKSTPLSTTAAQSIVARATRDPSRAWLTFSPYISQPVGRLLASKGIGFVDQAGNCHIAVGQDYLVHVEGRRPPTPSRFGRGLGARSYQVLFALLARPELTSAPIRSLAEAADVRKTTAGGVLQRLTDEGLVLRDKGGRRIARPTVLMDRWLAGYADKLRPRLIVGRYEAAARDPLAFEKHVEATLTDRSDWAWGGAAASYRLTRHYRGETTTLHVATQSGGIQRQLGVLPARDGRIVVLGVPGPLGLDGPAPHVAHPLLVYTELLVEGDERAREAAEEIYSRYLGQIG